METIAERILYWGTRIKAWNIPWVTGIFPGEMAAFLGMCDACNVDTIVECGRGRDAYSTQVLGEYAIEKNIEIASIDFNDIENESFCETMEKYSDHITFLQGDAFSILPQAFTYGERFALLVDGPKHHEANRLSVAATKLWKIHLLAHHNSTPGSTWRTEFHDIFPGYFYYENLDIQWPAFKAWEDAVVSGDLGDRTLAQSSLVMVAGPQAPKRFSSLYWKWRFMEMLSCAEN